MAKTYYERDKERAYRAPLDCAGKALTIGTWVMMANDGRISWGKVIGVDNETVTVLGNGSPMETVERDVRLRISNHPLANDSTALASLAAVSKDAIPSQLIQRLDCLRDALSV